MIEAEQLLSDPRAVSPGPCSPSGRPQVLNDGGARRVHGFGAQRPLLRSVSRALQQCHNARRRPIFAQMTRDGPQLPLWAGTWLGSPWSPRAIGSAEAMPPHCAAQDRGECPPHAGTRATALRRRCAGMAGNEPVTPVCVLGAEHMLCSGHRCPTGASKPLLHERLLLPRRVQGVPPPHPTRQCARIARRWPRARVLTLLTASHFQVSRRWRAAARASRLWSSKQVQPPTPSRPLPPQSVAVESRSDGGRAL